MKTKINFIFVVGCALALLVARAGWAGNNGYFITYNSNIEQGEVELALKTDLTAPSRFRKEDGQGNYFSHMLELEYAPLRQLATEFMVEWFEDLGSHDSKFGGFRWENRFRLFKDQVPLNPMLYLEYEDRDTAARFKSEVAGWVRPPYPEGEEPFRERSLESRLVLSQNIDDVDVAFNWINETSINDGVTEFGYSIGTMWRVEGHGENDEAREEHNEAAEKGIGVGLEMYGALGDTKSFALKPSRQQHYLAPIFSVHFAEHCQFQTQLALGLTKASDDLVRTMFAYEF